MDHAKGRNFSSTSSIFGDFSRTCAIEGGRLRLMLAEYTLLAAVDDEVIDEAEIRREALKARLSSESLLDAMPSGIADNEDIVTLGLGGKRDDEPDDADEVIDIVETLFEYGDSEVDAFS